MKGITIRGVAADGSFQPETTIQYVFGDLDHGNQPYLDESGQPLAVVTLRLMTRKDIRKMQKRYSQRVPNGNGTMVEELTDPEAYRMELVDQLIVSWFGLLSEELDANGEPQPLECSRRAKLALGEERLTHMMRIAVNNEQVAADAASFRRTDRVFAVVE